MNDLQIFKNEQFGEVKIIENDGQPWFVGLSVTEKLGYQNGSRDINRHVDEEDIQVLAIHDGTQTRNMLCVNESGLYSLIISSNLPTAKQFKHWVTSEVLPSIRQNGGYIANQENLSPAEIVAKALIVAQSIISEKDKLITEMQPKAEYFDELVERNLLTNFRDTAKELHVKEKDFINFLLENKYVYRDAKGKLHAYAEYTETGKELFEVKEFANDRYAGNQTLITPKGRETFRLLIKGI